MKFLLTLFIFLSACKGTQIYKPTINELNTKKYSIVSLDELLQNKGKYHGQFIATKGYFHWGFEERAIYYNIDISLGDTTVKYKDYCGLWIDFNNNHPFYHSIPDSLKNKLVTVKGYFDTTKTGHVGGCYRAALTNTFELKIVYKE